MGEAMTGIIRTLGIAWSELTSWQRVQLTRSDWISLGLRGVLGVPVGIGLLVGLLFVFASLSSNSPYMAAGALMLLLTGAITGFVLGLTPAVLTVIALAIANRVLGYLNLQIVLILAVASLLVASMLASPLLAPQALLLGALLLPVIAYLWAGIRARSLNVPGAAATTADPAA
jgi:hypothetical protein